MNRLTRRRRTPAYVAAAAAAVVPLAPLPAHGAAAPFPQPAGPVVFAYGQPRYLPSGNRAVWHWRIRNVGEKEVRRVVLTHWLAPKEAKVASMHGSCLLVQGGAVKCDYGTLRPGAYRDGHLVAKFPPEVRGRVQIQGSATWRDHGRPVVGPAVSPSPGRGLLPLDLGVLNSPEKRP